MSMPGPCATDTLPLTTPWLASEKVSAAIPPDLMPWLTEPDSLTEKLQMAFPGSFRVDVLWHDFAQPTQEEKERLALPGDEPVLIREVCLYCNEIPRVFARSIIPADTLEGGNESLKTFGAQSLGALLFSHPRSIRGEFELAQAELSPGFATELGASIEEGAKVWGRRSSFLLRNKPLLVAEFFLPSLFTVTESRRLEEETA